MNLKQLVGGMAALAVAASLAMSGCTEGYKWPRLDGKWTDKSAPMVKHEPAPAKPMDKPAPAPAPRAAAPAGATWMAFPTGDKATSAILVEKFAPTEVVLNQPFDYEIRVTNLTSMSLDNVVLSDNFSPNFKIVSSTPAAEGTAPSRWSLGTLAPGQSKSIKIQGQATAATALSSCASVSYTSSLCVNINVVQPSLKLTKSATPEALVCDTIQYKLVVSNPGSGMAKGVKIHDALPAGIADAAGKTTVDIDVGDLSPGQSKEYPFTAKATKSGSYVNSAQATAAGGLTADSGQVTTVIRQPVLAIKAECQGTILQGRNTTFKFTVTNNGDAACQSTVVTAAVPAGTQFVSADAGGTGAGSTTWNIGTLNPKESKTVSMTVRTIGAGEIKACATASCTCSPSVSDCCTTGVKGAPDIGTQLTDDNGVVQVGETHIFRYEVKNQGQVDLTNVKVVCSIDDGLEYVSSTLPTTTAAGRTITLNIGTLKIGEKLSINITCKGAKEGILIIRAETTSDQTKPVVNDEQVNYVAK